MKKKEYAYICPDCLFIDWERHCDNLSISHKCRMCESENMINTEVDINEFNAKVNQFDSRDEYALDFLGDDAKPNPLLVKMRHKIKKADFDKWSAEQDARNAQFEQVKASGVAYCPICHSTSIQAVTRKWRPLTGFMTNKVDRVCLKCGHKWQ